MQSFVECKVSLADGTLYVTVKFNLLCIAQYHKVISKKIPKRNEIDGGAARLVSQLLWFLDKSYNHAQIHLAHSLIICHDHLNKGSSFKAPMSFTILSVLPII